MKTILDMFQHVSWANVRILEAVKQANGGSASALSVLQHLLRAEQVWLTRLQGHDSSHIPLWNAACEWPELEQLLHDNEQGYEKLLHTLDESQLDHQILYRNQSGTPFTSTFRNILVHVALHGQYHRGQINASLRQHGHKPVGVDYILFERTWSV